MNRDYWLRCTCAHHAETHDSQTGFCLACPCSKVRPRLAQGPKDDLRPRVFVMWAHWGKQVRQFAMYPDGMLMTRLAVPGQAPFWYRSPVPPAEKQVYSDEYLAKVHRYLTERGCVVTYYAGGHAGLPIDPVAA